MVYRCLRLVVGVTWYLHVLEAGVGGYLVPTGARGRWWGYLVPTCILDK